MKISIHIINIQGILRPDLVLKMCEGISPHSIEGTSSLEKLCIVENFIRKVTNNWLIKNNAIVETAITDITNNPELVAIIDHIYTVYDQEILARVNNRLTTFDLFIIGGNLHIILNGRNRRNNC